MLGVMFMDQKNSTDGFKIPVNNFSDEPKDQPKDEPEVEVNDEPIEAPKEEVIDMAEVDKDKTVPEEISEPDVEEPTPEPVAPVPEPMVPASKSDLEVLRHKNKSLKVWLTVLLVIITALIVGFAVYFSQSNKAQSDLEASQAKNAQLQQQVNDQKASQVTKEVESLEAQVATLTADNKTLTDQNATLVKQVNSLNSYITELTKVATQLKTTCGADCSSITIPAPPTSTNTTTQD